MRSAPGARRSKTTRRLASLLLAPCLAPALLAQGGGANPDKYVVTYEELKAAMEPGRLIFDTSLKRRRIALQSILKQTADLNYSQNIFEEVAKLFAVKDYHPVAVKLVGHKRPYVVDVDNPEDILEVEEPPKRIPRIGNADFGGTGGEDGGRSRTPDGGRGRTPDLGPIRGSGGEGDQGGTTRKPGDGAPISRKEFEDIARDLENGIHNAILETLKAKGHEVAALNVFAQTLDMVKVILILSTKDLPDSRIRSTLTSVRSIIEREVLSAKYPGVSLAELSSFTLLNQKDGLFFEHPVLYWQLKEGSWTPAKPDRVQGEAPREGSVSARTGVEIEDYFTSRDFEPEEDFDERELLTPIQGF